VKDAATKNVVPECLGCERSAIDLLNLDGIAMFSSRAEMQEPPRQTAEPGEPQEKKRGKPKTAVD
jgi:hypothetical protein